MSKLKLILICIVIGLIVYVVIAITNTQTGIATVDNATAFLQGLTITKVTTSLSTVYALVLGLAGTGALSAAVTYAYQKLKAQFGQAVQTIKTQSSNLDFLSRQTDEISTASNLKDAAIKKVNDEKSLISTELNGYKTQVQTMTQQLETQKQTLEVLGKNAQSQVQASLPTNEIFTSADGKKQIIKIAEKYVT